MTPMNLIRAMDNRNVVVGSLVGMVLMAGAWAAAREARPVDAPRNGCLAV